MLSFEEARKRLLSSVERLDVERVGIFEAEGRVLAEDVIAPYPLPSFDHSSMDGYAVRSKQLVGGPPYELEITGTSAAGDAVVPAPSAGAVRIFTGAPLPLGMDTIVIQEDTTTVAREGKSFVCFASETQRNQWIRRRGDDLKEGAVALESGVRLGPGAVALAASLDRASLTVTRRPIVTVLGTGDELRAPGEASRPNSVVESNGLFVASAARRIGAVARLGAFVRDDEASARSAIERALAGTDVLVTIGGVSVGARDVVRPALEAAGVSIDFYKVAMKPGKPFTVGRSGRTVVLGLPGNPASASLAFLLFGVPLLRSLLGERDPLPCSRRMRVDGRLERSPGRAEFARAKLVHRDGDEWAELLANQASGAVTSFAEADALVVFEAARATYTGGERLEVIAIDAMIRG